MNTWPSSSRWLGIGLGTALLSLLTIGAGEHLVRRAISAGYAAGGSVEAEALIQMTVPASSLDNMPSGFISTFMGADACPPGWERVKLDDDGTLGFMAVGAFTDETGSLPDRGTGRPYSSYSIHIACVKL